MRVKVRQKADFHFVGSGEDFGGELPIDAAPHVGGRGRGFRPPALWMYSIASCMGIHTYEALHERGKQVSDIEVEADGERRQDFPKVYTRVRLRFRMKGSGLADGDIQEAIRTALTRTCSIAVMANLAAPITCEYEVDTGPTRLCGTVEAPPAKL